MLDATCIAIGGMEHFAKWKWFSAFWVPFKNKLFPKYGQHRFDSPVSNHYLASAVHHANNTQDRHCLSASKHYSGKPGSNAEIYASYFQIKNKPNFALLYSQTKHTQVQQTFLI